MAIQDDVKLTLRQAGEAFKKDIWKAEDEQFLASRAADLVGLNRKADAATDPNKRRAYQAAARDAIQCVKMLVLIRLEVAAKHLIEILGDIFMEKILPRLIQLLPVALAAI